MIARHFLKVACLSAMSVACGGGDPGSSSSDSTGSASTGGAAMGGSETGGNPSAAGGTGTGGPASALDFFVVNTYGYTKLSIGNSVVGYGGAERAVKQTYGSCTLFEIKNEANSYADTETATPIGDITATSSTLGTAKLTTTNQQAAFEDFSTPALGGESVHIQTTGNEYLPAFDADVAFPLAVIVQSPGLNADNQFQGAQGSDLVLTWERGADNVIVELRGISSGSDTPGLVTCRFDSLAGSGTLPAALTAQLTQIEITTIATKTVDVGTQKVTLNALMPVRHKDLDASSIHWIFF